MGPMTERRAELRPALGTGPPAAPWTRRLVGVQDEEQEVRVGREDGKLVRKQLASGWHWLRFADDGDPEARSDEGIDHRVQRPVPEAHLGRLVTQGPSFGPVVRREVVGLAPGLAVEGIDGKG